MPTILTKRKAITDLKLLAAPDNGKKVIIPFRYPGGKYYALSGLKRFWQACPHDEYREPFVGGGAVFFAKPKAKYSWINDFDSELVNTYQVMANAKLRPELVERLSKEIASKERWAEVRSYQPKSSLDRAYRYYYINRTSFSGKMVSPGWGYRPKRSLPPERWNERLNPCGQKLRDVKITCLDFEKVIASPSRGKGVLLFLDPPYYMPPKRKHYSNGFETSDHLRLASLLQKTKHSFILTYEDHPDIRKLYEWASIYPVEFFYRVDNSQENGPSIAAGRRRKGFELVICNFKVSK
ncbi:MAG: DNA adenine methylase [Elusimicrobia bacterium]|nr:DNA adenine methylase [Elusimicrobiota bacterium]